MSTLMMITSMWLPYMSDCNTSSVLKYTIILGKGNADHCCKGYVWESVNYITYFCYVLTLACKNYLYLTRSHK